MTARKLFYLHIPKTGGQTLATRLASAFPPQQSVILQHEFGPEERAAFLDLIATRTFVEAHVRGELLEGVGGLDIIATVRDPVAQMISNYRHLRRDPNNRWARAAHKLSPQAFFQQFGDFFVNHQTRYLLSAFSPLAREIERMGAMRALHARFYEALDKVRWLVPSEGVDEFVRLWALETQHPVADFTSRANEAQSDDVDVARLRAFLLDHPQLYAFDTLLHQAACEAFSAYRDNVYAALAASPYADNSRRAFSDDDSGVWLTKNFYAPDMDAGSPYWWAGPTTQSQIRICRREAQRFLCFDVNVVNGISPGQIGLYAGQDFRKLDVRLSQRSPSRTTICASLEDLGPQADIRILTPDCMASIMTTTTDDDLRRRSFLSSNWRLEAQAPA